MASVTGFHFNFFWGERGVTSRPRYSGAVNSTPAKAGTGDESHLSLRMLKKLYPKVSSLAVDGDALLTPNPSILELVGSLLCGNQAAGVLRHRRDIVLVTAPARWRADSRRCVWKSTCGSARDL